MHKLHIKTILKVILILQMIENVCLNYQISVNVECVPRVVALKADNNKFFFTFCRWIYNGYDYYGDNNLAAGICGNSVSGYSLMGIDSPYESSANFETFKTYLQSTACGK